MKGNRLIVRYTPSERINHWIVAICVHPAGAVGSGAVPSVDVLADAICSAADSGRASCIRSSGCVMFICVPAACAALLASTIYLDASGHRSG